ncbi:alpha-amylase family glycosyl hydrolase [Solirubrobacter phytolaccae]|uniref:Alpha-amylase family glycosyl hydrolase n=1 Tax=Solirubrobacter phytolaccae TaxID=1404360 RepID=A0A9X3SH20_9ACTN|nr:alpha-amylase family glycosyl hydrolase [Solirubrobacter phytolaccae]MDA0182972.1 alpha-amylase family glycosyl hydrolase [Solirubrobacter phytolaccae]
MTWWQRGAIYQVYPRSFQDSNADGVGDLEGVRRRLPYLKWLGVDGVWLSPFYRSPMADFGYDVADHRDVDPLFGTVEDFDALAQEARRLGLKLILDYVPNHTSIEHPWFTDHSEYFIWADEVPNNWVSNFGGPAWSPHGERFYYHAYLPEQPDLDWRNPDVRAAMLDVLRFWCEHGADGFRIDALRQLFKDDQRRDNPPNPDFSPGDDPYSALLPEFTTDRPEVQDAIRAFRATVGDRLLVGELYLPIERLVAYYASGLDLPSNFHLLSTPWTAHDVAELIERYEGALPDGAWPNWVAGNHDRPRLASRLPPGHERAAATLLLTLRGTPTLYYGDEIGMRDVEIPPERRVDPWVFGNRDPVRTPMQWDADGSFTEAEHAWLPFAPDHTAVNVATQQDDPDSLLHHYRHLLAARRAFADAPYRTVSVHDNVLTYARGEAITVTIDFNTGASQLHGPESVQA